jgi:hypothetical protein
MEREREKREMEREGETERGERGGERDTHCYYNWNW